MAKINGLERVDVNIAALGTHLMITARDQDRRDSALLTTSNMVRVPRNAMGNTLDPDGNAPSW